MQPILINNFLDNAPLQIRTIEQTDGAPLVALTQFSGAMNFQHAMTIEQACDMAKKILGLVYTLETEK